MIMRHLGFGSVTALAIAVAALIGSPGQSKAEGPEKAIANAQKAKSFEAKISLTLPKGKISLPLPGAMIPVSVTVTSQKSKVRLETDTGLPGSDYVMLVDYPKKKGLTLIEGGKLALWNSDPIDGFPVPETVAKKLAATEVSTVAAALAEMKGAKFEPLPDDEIEKISTKVFTVKEFVWPDNTDKADKTDKADNAAKMDVTLWIDPKTQTVLKLRVEYKSGDHQGTTMDALFKSWNEELEESQFDLKVPNGYQQRGEAPKD